MRCLSSDLPLSRPFCLDNRLFQPVPSRPETLQHDTWNLGTPFASKLCELSRQILPKNVPNGRRPQLQLFLAKQNGRRDLPRANNAGRKTGI